MTIFSRLLRGIRNRGVYRTLLLVIEHFVYDRRTEFIIHRKLLAECSIDDAFSYRRAMLDDLELLRAFRSSMRINYFRDLLSQGDLVFIALKEGRPAAYHLCSSRGRTRLPYSQFFLREAQIWVVDIFTLPEYRRHNIAS